MGKIVSFYAKKRQRQLKRKLTELAEILNSSHYVDPNFLRLNYSDDIFELERTFTLFERVYEVVTHKQAVANLERDLDLFNQRLETYSSCFMFPSVLAPYRRGINPVKALYNEVQKTLLKPVRKDTKQKWLLGLFKDKAWFRKLDQALLKDINAATVIISRYQHVEYNSIQTQLMELNQFKQDLIQFRIVFKSLRR